MRSDDTATNVTTPQKKAMKETAAARRRATRDTSRWSGADAQRALTRADRLVAPSSARRIASMVRLDFYRLFHTPLLYIMVFISAFVPAMVLSMTGSEAGFTNTWQVVEMARGGNDGMGLLQMAALCVIDMVYIFAALTMSIFVAHDYSSGFVKSIFTVHSHKADYAVSKSLVGIFSGLCMLAIYLAAAIGAGLLTGMSFSLGEAGVAGLVLCLLSKAVLLLGFIPMYLAVAVFFRERMWVSIIGSFVLGIVFYPVAMLVSPLDATVASLGVSVLLAAVLAVVGLALTQLFLARRDLA